MPMRLKLYGSRGTLSFFSRGSVKYGGNTMCACLETGGRTVLLDAGSGLMAWSMELAGRAAEADILVSHLHLDHIAGLPVCPPLLNADSQIRIFTRSRDSRPIREQLLGLFRPPHWPVRLEDLCCAEVTELSEEPFELAEGLLVTSALLPHNDGTTGFRIDAEGKSVAYLLDCEIAPGDWLDEGLLRLCRGADVVFFDASYLPADYPAKRGWGHSDFEAGLRLKQASGCKTLVLTHLAPEYGDETLEELARTLRDRDPDCLLAYDGWEMEV